MAMIENKAAGVIHPTECNPFHARAACGVALWTVLQLTVGVAAVRGATGRASAEPPGTVERKGLVQVTLAPRSVVEREPGHYLIDFGKACFAAFEYEIENPDTGRQVIVHLGEAATADGAVNRKPSVCVRYHRATNQLRAGVHVYRPSLGSGDVRGMPADVGPVMPFRYVELENAPAGLKAGNFRQRMVHYPFEDDAADFSCSDEKLNAVWALCKHTIKATSFCGLFVDGDRERSPYEADAYINQLGWYACTTDTTLPRYSHEHLIKYSTWPTEWRMCSVLMAWEDYLHTADAASVNRFYDRLCEKTLSHLARADGLISTFTPPGQPKRCSLNDIVDWPAGERDGCQMLPINTVVNAFHIRSLQLMARLAEVAGKPQDAARFAASAVRAAEAFNAKLWDAATGLYVDGEGATHASLHANMFPLAFGLVPPERRAKVVAFVRSRGMACSVYGAQFLLESLFENGEAAHALALITAPGKRSWRYMIEDVGATMTLEAWNIVVKHNLDWNHAWVPPRPTSCRAMSWGCVHWNPASRNC